MEVFLLVVLCQQVHMKLTALEVKELLIEFPNSLELLQHAENPAPG
jgi:hypothetical protein